MTLRMAMTAVGAAIFALAAAPVAADAARIERIERLDQLGKRSYFAFVEKADVARTAPATTAAPVAKLTRRSTVGTDDLVAVVARTVDERDRVWLQVRLPVRPNGTTGWVPESALSELQPIDTWLKIDTKAYKLTLIKDGKTVFSARVGVGQKQWPTPKGQFFIRARLEKYGGAGSAYGPIAFITS